MTKVRDGSPLWEHVKRIWGTDPFHGRSEVVELPKGLEPTLQYYAPFPKGSLPMIVVELHDGSIVGPAEFIERFALR